MTREQVQNFLPIMKAYAEGRTVQVQSSEGWVDIVEPAWGMWEGRYREYRVKPEPRYVRYTYETFMRAKGWEGPLVNINNPQSHFIITEWKSDGVRLINYWCSWEHLFLNFKHIDGTPCGTIETGGIM